jgi:muramoyltetrapeptide carboxypeptidase LdcA involved in peptidoglycan recycling
MIKPQKLKKGDKIATVSLSWGGAGDTGIIERYKIAKRRIEEKFGLEVIEMTNTLKGSEYLYRNPKARAEDILQAFSDKEIKAIFCNIGGDETIRLLPYIDFKIIKNNPKIFMGYSDTTANHFMCYKAGLTSFYGPCVLDSFAENVEMHDYTVKWIKKVLFSSEKIGDIEKSDYWTSEYLEWTNPENNNIKRKVHDNKEYELLQGIGKVRGKLIGGCIEVLEMIKATNIWPDINEWEDKILFLETSEEKPSCNWLRYWLRNYGAIGVFDKISGIIVGKPKDETYFEEYKKEYIKVIRDEFGKEDLPIMYNMNFGHTAPMCILPYGVESEIDCESKKFTIIESAVV